MNDWKTKDIVAWILGRLGYKLLYLDALNGENIDIYIKYIKHKYSKNDFVKEFIDYFL